MGFLGKLFGGKSDNDEPPTRERFSETMVQRIRAGGETSEISCDLEKFAISTSRHVFNLHNAYAEYCRAESDQEREKIIRVFLTTWFTARIEIPDEFEDAKSDIFPALRSRSFFEVDCKVHSVGKPNQVETPYAIVGEVLAVAAAYDLPTSLQFLTPDALDNWGISLYEALEVAKENLLATTDQYGRIESAYLISTGDSYDATRLILTGLIEQFDVQGDAIAMVPNRECLLISGAEDDAGLETILSLAEQQVQHERFITGLAFRLDRGEWEPWMPATSHPLFRRFRELQVQSIGTEYENQKQYLERVNLESETDIFVASYMCFDIQETGKLESRCTWTKDCHALLPKTDVLYFYDPESKEVVASGTWERIEKLAGDLMEQTDLYPARWRVRDFPNADLLAEIGQIEDPPE